MNQYSESDRLFAWFRISADIERGTELNAELVAYYRAKAEHGRTIATGLGIDTVAAGRDYDCTADMIEMHLAQEEAA